MVDKPFSHPPTLTWAVYRRMTHLLVPLLWCLGFLGSLHSGCSAPRALSEATAYTLSGFVGWAVYLRWWRRAYGPLLAACIAWGSISMLKPTQSDWPFVEMLIEGVARSLFMVLGVGLAMARLTNGRKRTRTPPAHPLTDAELDQPFPGVATRSPS